MNKVWTIIIAATLWIAAMVIFAQKGAGYEERVCSATSVVSVRPGAFSSLVEPVFTTKELVLGMIASAGYDPMIADKVIQLESGWDVNAVGDSSRSFGIWQINLYKPNGEIVHGIGEKCATDPHCSTEYAIKLLKSERSWFHWTGYTIIFGKK